MDIENTQELSELEIFSDGFGIKPENPMSPEYATDAVGYLHYDKSAPDAQQVVSHAASLTVSRLTEAFQWIINELIDTDLTLDFMLDDSTPFFAQCTPTKSFPNRAITIYFGLGCIPVLVGITNRLLHMQKSGPIALEAEMQGRSSTRLPEEKWHPKTNPVGVLYYDYGNERDTSTSTADAALLIFFHEVGHALRGHSWISPGNNDSKAAHRRSLESDADWCAGYLFMKYTLLNLSEEDRLDERKLSEVCECLAVASASLNCSLQTRSDNTSEQYHLPHIRNRDNSYGAELAWREQKLPFNFVHMINKAYGQLMLLDGILGHRLEQWVALDDPRNISDEEERKLLTESIVRNFHSKALGLERGPIKGARVLWASIMYPAPNYAPRSYYNLSARPSIGFGVRGVQT